LEEEYVRLLLSALAASVVLACGTGATSEEGEVKDIRIYVHTDLEGITGIDTFEMIQRDGKRYRQCCELLMGDINASVDGAFAGGARHVTVLDSHGGGNNFIKELLDPRAEWDPKANRQWWGKLDDSYSGTFFVGAHAMAGTINGFLDHTQNSLTWYNYFVNGRKTGELGQWGIVAGSFGVPMLMVSGDEAACVEARQFFTPVETAVVKRGLGRNRAELVETAEARARIREAARESIALIGTAKPYVVTMPMEIILEFNRSDFCEEKLKRDGVERIDARKIRKVTSNPLALLP
jgi:D-amino peptidase